MHPWIWLNEPQHSSAVSALTAFISTWAALIAIFFTYRAYREAKRQADAADAQTQIARESAEAAHRRQHEEDARREAERRAEFKRRKAEEDALRPRIEYVGGFSYVPGDQADPQKRVVDLTFTNRGATEAIDLVIFGSDFPKVVRPVVQVSQEIIFTLPIDQVRECDFLIRYATRYGSTWLFRTSGEWANIKLVLVDVLRPYATNSEEDDAEEVYSS